MTAAGRFAILMALGALAVVGGTAASCARAPRITPPAQAWQAIENRWFPPREEARASLSGHSADFAAQLQDYMSFYDATRGWVEDVRAYPHWFGAGSDTLAYDVDRFLSDSDEYLALLRRAYQAAGPSDIVALADSLPLADRLWDSNVRLIRLDLGLPVAPGGSP